MNEVNITQLFWMEDFIVFLFTKACTFYELSHGYLSDSVTIVTFACTFT